MRIQACLLSLCFAALVVVASAMPSQAATLFSEDFDDITLTSDPLQLTTSTPGSSFTSTVSSDSSLTAITARTLSPTDPFGAGNQFLELIDGSDTTATIRGTLSSAIIGTGFTVSFDFYDPSASNTRLGDPVNRGGRMYLSSSDSSTTADRTIDMDLLNGTFRGLVVNGGSNVEAGNYTENAAHNLVLVGNLSNATINYFMGGPQSVAPGTYDIYIDGSLLPMGDNMQFRNPSVTSIASISFAGAGSGTVSETYFDNIVVSDTVPVPEPSSRVLMALALTTVVGLRRKHRQ